MPDSRRQAADARLQTPDLHTSPHPGGSPLPLRGTPPKKGRIGRALATAGLTGNGQRATRNGQRATGNGLLAPKERDPTTVAGMKKLIGAFITLVAVSVAMWLVGQSTAKKFRGDTHPDDDSFRLMAFLGGSAVKSHATPLRSVEAKVRAAGLDLDLTEATLSAEGAHIDLDVKAGGVQLTVPADWRVYVVQHVEKGEVDVDVPDPESLPNDAPILTVQAEVKAGGVAIKSKTRPLIPA